MFKRLFSSTPQTSPVNLKIWKIQDASLPPSEVFPEQKLRYVNVGPKSVGMCCSGGGSRAHTLSAGFFRGLRDLKLDDKVVYLSAVSGGSWASSIYTFAKEDDQTLLGKSTTPEELTLEYLKNEDPGKLSRVLDVFYGVASALYMWLIEGIPTVKLWQEMVGRCLLRPFRLNHKVMALNEAQLEDLLKRNEGNEFVEKIRNKFVFPKEGRPFLIVNCCLDGPLDHSTGWGNSLQCTPLYTGVPFYRDSKKMVYVPDAKWSYIKFLIRRMLNLVSPRWLNDMYYEQMIVGNTEGCVELSIGGGVVETFSYGVEKLDNHEDYYAETSSVLGDMGSTPPFFIEDAIGGSSAAFVSSFNNRNLGANVTPVSTYFPILSRENTTFSTYQAPGKISIGDGGNYDNTGLLPLIQRGVKKILCCINCAVPLDVEGFKNDYFTNEPANDEEAETYDPKKAYYCADTQLLSLFGALNLIELGYNYCMNQVFQKEKLNDVMNELIANVKSGRGAIARQTLTVVKNPIWNIVGGYDIEVLFLYNEHCDDFVKELPAETRAALKNPNGNFYDYPFYRTMFQNQRPFSLKREQVNLLSAQAEYILKRNEDLVQKFFQ